MNEETIEKIISKYKLYMSMDSYEYEAITKVDLYKLIEEIERLNNIINEVREKLLCYGETFDLKLHQQMQKELLEILDKEKV